MYYNFSADLVMQRHLTHLPLVPHVYIYIYINIILTNIGLLSIGLLEANLNEIGVETLSIIFIEKMHLKMLSEKLAAILSRGRWVKMEKCYISKYRGSRFGLLWK